MSFQRAVTLILAGGLFFYACKKPAIDDTALLPKDRLDLRFTDTLTVKAHTVKEDSLDVSAATLCLLGSMDDPDLGYTNASFYIPFKLLTSNLVLDDTTVTLDSAVLSLEYFGDTYGDWRTPQTIEVFEMNENMIDSVSYFSDKTFGVNANPVGEKNNFIPNTKDSIKINGNTFPPALRIKLDNSFAQKFVDSSGTSVYADNVSFRGFFKGLYVTASKAGGGQGLVAFDPYESRVKLTIYYHDVQDSALSYDFPADPGLVVNHYVHDYQSSPYFQLITDTNTERSDSLIFIQGLAGVNTKFIVPNIKNLGNILINKAELVVTLANSDTAFFAPPAKLTLIESDENGNFGNATPDQVFPTSIFGGNKTETTDSFGQKLTQYKFSLSRYYQEIITKDKQDFGIFILPEKRYQTPNRIMGGGGNHSKYSMKLNLTYDVIQ